MNRRLISASAVMLAVLLLAQPSAYAAPQGGDVSIAMSASPTALRVGEVTTYSIRVSVKGGAATGVTVTDQLPGALTLESASSSQGTCTQTQTVTCSLGDMARNGTASVEISVRAKNQGAIWNTVTVTSSSSDQHTDNNAAWVKVDVAPPPLPPLPARCSAVSPQSSGCGTGFSVKEATPVTLSFTDKPLSGTLSAGIWQYSPDGSTATLVAQMSATFLGGQATSGSTSTRVSLAPANYFLDVRHVPDSVRRDPIPVFTWWGLGWNPYPEPSPVCVSVQQPLTTVQCAYSWTYYRLPSLIRDGGTVYTPGVWQNAPGGSFGAEVTSS